MTTKKDSVQATSSTDSALGVVHIEEKVPHHHHPHAEHGPLVDHELASSQGNEDDEVHPELWWSKIRHTIREPLSEFFGVFILILFGDGVVAQVVLSNGEKGDYQSISWGWG